MAHHTHGSERAIGDSTEYPPLPSNSGNSAELTRPSQTVQQQEQNQQKKSFAEVLTNTSRNVESQNFFPTDSKPTVGTRTHIDGRPTLIFNDTETLSLAAAFRYALVGKFSHGAPQYRNLHRLITELGIKGAFTVSMINARHVLISLSNEADFSRLWLRRIWYIQGFPMRVFKWTPTFTPTQESSIVPVWIDDATLNQSKLSKARVGIEIDLTAPIVEDFDLQINGRTIQQKVVYEQVPKYCNLCKHVGHDNLECYSMGNAPRPPPRSHTVRKPKGKEKKTTDERVAMEIGECSKTMEDRPRYASIDTSNEVLNNEKNDNACIAVVRNIEENDDIAHVNEIDDANVYVNEEKVMNAIIERDANLEDNVGMNGLNVTNVNLSVGAHLSNYFFINALEKWEKRPKRIKLKEAVQLFKYLKHLGRVCPGARYCKVTFEKGSRFVEAIAKGAGCCLVWAGTNKAGTVVSWAGLAWARAGSGLGRLDWGRAGGAAGMGSGVGGPGACHNATSKTLRRRHGFRPISQLSAAFPTSDHLHSDRRPMANVTDRLVLGFGDPPEFTLNPAEFPSLKPTPTESTRLNSANSQPPSLTKLFSETVAANRRPSTNEHRFFLANSTTISFGEKTVCDGRPTLVFSDSETASLTEAYRFSLVGKFSQGTPQYRNLHRLIAGLGLRGAFTVGMINTKHVLITLSDEADFSKLWIRRIWFIQGYPMRVFKWSPTFSPAHESSVVPIWVCFPGLPVHLFQKEALCTVASMIGTPLQIDEYTFNQAKLSKARVCIEIDLLQPRIEEIDIQIHGVTIRQKIEYEQIPKYCSLCKHVGHRATECYSKGNAPKPPPRVKTSAVYRQKQQQQTVQSDEHQVLDALPEQTNKSETCENSSSRYNVETVNISAHKEDDKLVAVSEVIREEVYCIPENDTNERENHANAINGIDEIDVINPSTIVCDNDENVEHAIDEIDANYPLEIGASEEIHKSNGVNDPIVGNEIIGVMMLSPIGMACDLMRRKEWIKMDSALNLLQNIKQFGIVIQSIKIFLNFLWAGIYFFWCWAEDLHTGLADWAGALAVWARAERTRLGLDYWAVVLGRARWAWTMELDSTGLGLAWFGLGRLVRILGYASGLQAWAEGTGPRRALGLWYWAEARDGPLQSGVGCCCRMGRTTRPTSWASSLTMLGCTFLDFNF
ncbi:UNVERIFIED_CONTAM: hypothetical protein Sradi_4094500 [Sesamum radiatum]|uniref:DUF4283 domain-containing protein n=1 Tax=Sesamum radiatum TaxID=300843 RepID=A0AAW2PLN6_SESRA